MQTIETSPGISVYRSEDGAIMVNLFGRHMTAQAWNASPPVAEESINSISATLNAIWQLQKA